MSTRSYRSPRREAAALATRAAVLEAAESLFIGRGFAATTLAAVAEAADVSLATVKLVAPTKSALLLEAMGARVRGSSEPEAVSGRIWWDAMLSETDPRQLVRRWVSITALAHQRQAKLFEVVMQAGLGHPELAETESRGGAGRRENFRKVLLALDAMGALRGDLDSALDIACALNSPHLYRLFMRCGWPLEQWSGWLEATLIAQLVQAAPGG